MKLRRLGRTEVEVTELGFGGASIGNLYSAVDENTAAEAVRAAWEGGVRYFDTAPHYGLGLSERRLGSALAGYRRDQFVVSTKVGRLLVTNPAPTGSDMAAGGFDVPDDLQRLSDFSADGVRRSLDESLQRLGLDRVDLVYVHDAEQQMDTAITEAVPALAELRDQGVVGAVGVGMNLVEPLRRFVAETDIDAVMIAGRWTLVDRSGETLLMDCLRRGVSVIAAAPFNSGLLSQRWPTAGAYFDYAAAPEHMVAAARALAMVCAQNHIMLPHAAMQFPLQHDAVSSVVAGMRTAAQARSATDWFATPLASSLWGQIDDALKKLR